MTCTIANCPYTNKNCQSCSYYIGLDKIIKAKAKCRFCNSENLKAMNNNGIMGNGYAEWNYCCKDCGKVQ